MTIHATKPCAVAGLVAMVSVLLTMGKVHAADDFTMSIMDVFSITGRGAVITGPIETGAIAVGDVVCVPLTSGETVGRAVKGIEVFRELLDEAEAGQSVGVLVEIDRKLVDKGALLHSDCELSGNEG